MAVWLPNYQHRRKLSTDSTKVDANLTNFPTLVKLTSVNFNFTKSTATGNDVRFTLADGTTLLDYERGRHDSTALKAEYWVKIPSVSATAPTDFYIYYSTDTGIADGANPTAVWDANTKAHWSLKEDPAGTAPQMKDSTVNANHGTSVGAMTNADSVEGKIGKALDFDGVDDYVEVSYSATLNPSVFTVEAWARVTGGAGTWRSVITSRNWPPRQGYIIYAASDDFWQFWIGDEGAIWRTITGPAVVLNQWIHLVARYDGTEMRFYTDGTLVGSLVTAFSRNQSHPLRIGAGTTETMPLLFFNGLIDETRISNITRSPAWIKASYNSGNDTLLTYGAEEVLVIFSEIFILSDTITKKPIKTLSEVFNITDTIQKGIRKALSEAFTIIDSIIVRFIKVKILSEVLTITDTIQKTVKRILSEAIAITDTIIMKIIKVFLDTITITDTIKKIFKKVLLEIIKIFDKIKLPFIWIKKGRPTITWSKDDKPTITWIKKDK